MRLCWEFHDLRTPWGPIKLEQRGVHSFRVTYGKQVDDGLTYGRAAAMLGSDIMHWLACESHLDNRTRTDQRAGYAFDYVSPPADHREPLRELRRRIGAFRVLCEEGDETDTGAAWELLDDIEDALKVLG